MAIAVCADKGSPGATTVGLALAAAWPGPAVLVEADPYGGDLAIRCRTGKGAALPEAPSVLTLATAARTSGSPGLVARYAHRVNDQVSVVPGHLAAEQVSGVADWQPLGDALAASARPVIIDVGRLHGSSPVVPVAAAADLVVLVARPDTGSVVHLRERVCRLVPALAARRQAPVRYFPILVSPTRHGHADVTDLRRVLAETPAAPLIVGAGFLAWDPAGLRRLEAGEDPRGRLSRTSLLRSARELTAQLSDLLTGTDQRRHDETDDGSGSGASSADGDGAGGRVDGTRRLREFFGPGGST